VSEFVSIIWPFIVLFIAIQPNPHDWRYRFLAPFGSLKHTKPVPGALREDAMIISVTRDGRYFFGGSEIRPEILPSLNDSRLKEGAERKIYMSVDGRVKHWDLSFVLEQVRLTGLQDVCFLVH
jgi:biopolymer transport protein ExbD